MKDRINKNGLLIIAVLIATLSIIISCNPEKVEINHGILKEVLIEYIKTDMINFAGVTAFDGEIFIAYNVLGERFEQDILKCYLHVLCQEYYVDNGQLKEGTGASFPIALDILIINNIYKIMDHEVPRDGEAFASDVRRIIPEEFRNKLSKRNFTRNLSQEVQKEAQEYFKETIK